MRLLRTLGPAERPRAAVTITAGLLDVSCADEARLPALIAAATDAGDLDDAFSSRAGWEGSVLACLSAALCARPSVAAFIARVAVPKVAAAVPHALRLWIASSSSTAGQSSQGRGQVQAGRGVGSQESKE